MINSVTHRIISTSQFVCRLHLNPLHTCSYLSFYRKFFGPVLIFLFFLLLVQFSWSSMQLRCSLLVISPTQPQSSWSWPALEQPITIQRQLNQNPYTPHYLFTDSSRLIWKRAVKNDECSPCLSWYTLFNVSSLKLLSAVLDAAAVLLKLSQMPLGSANPTVLYLLHRWTCNDLKVFSTVFLLKQSVQSLEYLLDVILWKKPSYYWVLEGN